jgi:hypothetical protein
MTDLTAKFTALEVQLTAQHDIVAEKLDTIITALGDINTTLTTNGAFDTAPIVDAITSLRGTGPENTIQSVNQSLWNIAGPTPGKSLADLYALWDNGAGITPYNLLDSIYLAIQNMYELWNPSAGITPYNLLDSIYLAITANGITEDSAKAIMVRLIAQFDTSAVYPTMKDLLMTISAQQAQQILLAGNPLTMIPADICESPLVSTGEFFQDATLVMVDPVTYATWPAAPGGEFTASYDITMDAHPILHCSDWASYRIYVASKADTFGVITGRGTRYPCNQWLTLAIPEGGAPSGAAFNVARASGLTVYICGANAPALGSCSPAAQDPITVSAFSRHLYVPDPPLTTWYPSAMSGGNTWSNIVDIVIDGTNTVQGMIFTGGGGLLEMCMAWNTSHNATITHVGLHTYIQSSPGEYTIIAGTGANAAVSVLGDVASTNLAITSLDTAPFSLSDAIFVPFIDFNNADTPLSVAFSISWLPPGWNAT